MDQNVNLTPTCAAKGMPTVVPGPKKSPNTPAATLNWLRLVIGTPHAGVGQRAVAFARCSWMYGDPRNWSSEVSTPLTTARLATGVVNVNGRAISACSKIDNRNPPGMKRSRQNKSVRHIFSRRAIASRRECVVGIACSIYIIEEFAHRATPSLRR